MPAQAAQPASAPSPALHEYANVILVSLQCLRPDHLGTYGYQRDVSRNIDALARRSVVFENAIAQASLTPVAQMSILTSQYARIHGMVSFEVAKDQVTPRSLPEILKFYGYTNTAVISSPEFFVRFNSATGTTINTGDVYSRSFDEVVNTRRGLGPRNIRKIPDESLEWIRANKDGKFFLWIASGLLHMPYGAAVPEQHRARFDPPGYTPFWKRLPQLPREVASNPDPAYNVLSRVYRNEFFWEFAPVYRLQPEDIAYVNARYDAGVFYTDRFIGELVKLLDELGLTEKTLVVLHSSHGDDLGERDGFFHYDVTEGVVRDALIVQFPGREFGGRRVPQQVQSIDIMPTVLDYLGIPSPHEAQGGSLMPLVRGERTSAPSEYAYIDRIPWWEYTLSKWYLEFQGGRGAHFAVSERPALKEYQAMLRRNFDPLGYPPGDIAIRTNEWKLIVRKDLEMLNRVSWWSFITGKRHDVAEIELYDLKNDPTEQVNVAAKHPEVVAKLKEKVLAWDRSVEKRKARYEKNDTRFIIPYP
jgi:arylsulfatase A-like enzyme